MNVALALGVLAETAASVSILTRNLMDISLIVQRAQSEGRSDLTSEEWEHIQQNDEVARKRLEQALQKASSANT